MYGKIVERRDQVLITCFFSESFCASTFFNKMIVYKRSFFQAAAHVGTSLRDLYYGPIIEPQCIHIIFYDDER